MENFLVSTDLDQKHVEILCGLFCQAHALGDHCLFFLASAFMLLLSGSLHPTDLLWDWPQA